MENNAKIAVLKDILEKLDHVAVAFSGGVDSFFLAYLVRKWLGRDKTVAVTVVSPLVSRGEKEEAVRLAGLADIRHEIIDFNPLNIPEVAGNNPSRCYHCKKEIFNLIRSKVLDLGFSNIADGTNADDLNEDRPGLKALREAGIRSPLAEAGLTKKEIRLISREMSLPTADKPSSPCLATRFPYNSGITIERIEMVDRLESIVKKMGFRDVRARHLGQSASIEVKKEQVQRLMDKNIQAKLEAEGKQLGFQSVTIDPRGYGGGKKAEGGNLKPELGREGI